MKKLLVLALFVVGCTKPQPPNRAALAPEVTPSCPAGYKALSKHEGQSGVDRGLGFTVVHYTEGGIEKQLVCTQDDGKVDPRVNRPASGSIPEPK